MAKPKYPSAFMALSQFVVDVLFKSAVVGVVLVHLLHSSFQRLVQYWEGEMGYSERSLFVTMVVAVHASAYIVINGLFGLFDYTGMFKHYKIGRKPYMKPSMSLIMRTLGESLFNQAFVTPVAAYFLYDFFVYLGMLQMNAPLPSNLHLFVSFTLAEVFNQFMFFFFHSTFHLPFLYATFHKQHHTYTGTISIAAEYAGPSETILAGQLPTMGGIALAATHPLAIVVWLLVRLRQTFEVHSGYCFKGSILGNLCLMYPEETAFHDYHHTVNKGNYGYLMTDWLFGTMDDYVAMGMADGYVELRNRTQQ